MIAASSSSSGLVAPPLENAPSRRVDDHLTVLGAVGVFVSLRVSKVGDEVCFL